MRVAIASDDVIKALETFAKAIGIIESSCRFLREFQEVSPNPPGALIEYIGRDRHTILGVTIIESIESSRHEMS